MPSLILMALESTSTPSARATFSGSAARRPRNASSSAARATRSFSLDECCAIVCLLLLRPLSSPEAGNAAAGGVALHGVADPRLEHFGQLLVRRARDAKPLLEHGRVALYALGAR